MTSPPIQLGILAENKKALRRTESYFFFMRGRCVKECVKHILYHAQSPVITGVLAEGENA